MLAARTLLASLALAALARAQEAGPPPPSPPVEVGAVFEVQVEVTERFEQRSPVEEAPSTYVDVHRLVALDRVDEVGAGGVPTRLTRHVVEQTTCRTSHTTAGRPRRTIAVGRQVTLRADAAGAPLARKATWANGEEAEEIAAQWQLVPEDPRLWRGAATGDVTDRSARPARPPVVGWHLDRLPTPDDRGTWRLEVEARDGWTTARLTVESERDPTRDSPSKHLTRLEVTTRLRRAEARLPATPLPPPVRCERCEGAGEVWCERCGPPGEGAKPACGPEAHSVLRLVTCPACEGRRKR